MTLALPNKLSEDEQKQRDAAEERIRHGLHETWLGFAQIRDGRLWRSTHTSFEVYCQDQWGRGEKQGYHLAAAGDVIQLLLDSGETILPTNERQARALSRFPTDLRPVIMKTAENLASTLKKKVTAERIERIGEILMQAITTGIADVNGESTPLDAALVETEHEAMLRQREHIRANSTWAFERAVKYTKGRAGTFEVLQMLADLDPQIDHSIRAYKEKNDDR